MAKRTMSSRSTVDEEDMEGLDSDLKKMRLSEYLTSN